MRRAPSAAFRKKTAKKIRLPAPFAPSESQKTRRAPRKKREKRRGGAPSPSPFAEPHTPSSFAQPRRRLTRLGQPPPRGLIPPKTGLALPRAA